MFLCYRATVIVAAFAALSAVACKKTAPHNALERVQAAGQLVIGVEGTYPPHTYHDETNKLVGFDVEVAEAIAAKLGVRAAFVESAWDSLIIGLDSALWDTVINQVGVTAARQEKYDFSAPYSYARGVVVVRADDERIAAFADLSGKQAAQTITSNWAQTAERYGATLVSTAGFNESIRLVLDGRADATINDDVTYADYLKEHPGSPVKIAAYTDDVTTIAAIFAKNQTELVAAVNQALAELSAEGELSRLSLKYLNLDVTQK